VSDGSNNPSSGGLLDLLSGSGGGGETILTIKEIRQSLAGLGQEARSAKDAFDFLGTGAQQALGGALTGAADGLSKAFAQLGATGKLSMATVAQAVRKAVGLQLEQLGALAMVRALFELAAGFASLFLNPAEAGAHFQAAALFGLVGVAASVAGGAIAGAAGGRSPSAGPSHPDLSEPEAGPRQGAFTIQLINHGTIFPETRDFIVDAVKEAVGNDHLILVPTGPTVQAA